MGGRRATSIAEVLGPRRSPVLERQLQSALDTDDVGHIVSTSSRLAERAVTNQQLDGYISHFLPFIQRESVGAAAMSAAELRTVVRAEWRRIESGLRHKPRPPIRDALIQAVINYLRRYGG